MTNKSYESFKWVIDDRKKVYFSKIEFYENEQQFYQFYGVPVPLLIMAFHSM